ncbi:MAG: alpha/beta hydrolase [Proteobacteria bacterium]|nr:alpha/beta hydrolase [Pseudomonadota bacterium]
MAQAASRPVGPLVWRDMDQQALDDAYDQPKYAPNRDIVMRRRAWMSDRVRAVIGAPQRLAYGQSEIEQLDVFRTGAANAPVHVFIHGGAWRGNKAADYALQAEAFVRAGAHYVIPDFTNVDATGGDLMPLYEQVRRAVAFVLRNAARFGGDPARVYLSGHSSGAHLAGCVLAGGLQQEGLPTDALRGAFLVSGMYDLKPVRLSKRSTYVRLTDAIEEQLSAQRHIGSIHTPLLLAHGTTETPEFIRQTRDFHAALQAAGLEAQLIVGEGYNHFELLETMSNPYGVLGRAALAQMQLAHA